jgi:hypothetical protein
MALPVTRTSIVYVDGLKIEFAKSNSFDMNTNNQEQVGVSGYLGSSIGAKITKIEFDEIIPTSKLQSNVIKKYILADKSAVLTLKAGDSTFTVEGFFNQFTITGESMNGTLSGKFTFTGGRPRLLGTSPATLN